VIDTCAIEYKHKDPYKSTFEGQDGIWRGGMNTKLSSIKFG